MNVKDLESQIMKLDLNDRAALAKRIVNSLDELSEAEIEALWIDEGERRLDELEQGMTTGVPAAEAIRRAKASIS